MAGKRARAEQAAARPLPPLVAMVPGAATLPELADLMDRAAHWPVVDVGLAIEILPVIAARVRHFHGSPALATQLDSDAQCDPKTLGHHRAYLAGIASRMRLEAAAWPHD